MTLIKQVLLLDYSFMLMAQLDIVQFFYFRSRDNKIIISLINVEFDKINECIMANKLSPNVKKSKFN